MMAARVLQFVFVCMSLGASELVWYGFALLACPYTRAWRDACVCFCVCAMLTCVLLVCCMCVRVSCMKHVSLSVCVRMGECEWHMCAIFPHLFMRAYAKCSCARLFMLTCLLCVVYTCVYDEAASYMYLCV